MIHENGLTIYTDGSARGNPGRGGYGAILIWKGHRKELSAGYRLTTNNRMELTAVIQALDALKEPCHVALHTDSRYVIDGITKWIFGWQKNGWINSQKKPVLNADLWQQLLEARRRHRVDWIWVKGHDGHPENERADRLASDAALAGSQP